MVEFKLLFDDKKRKAAEEAANNRPTKYMKRGDIERMKLEEEAAMKEAASKAKQEEALRSKTRKHESPTPVSTPEPSAAEPATQFNISNEEAIRRLRTKGQPIRLFGETDKDRRLRLRALELIEERVGDKTMGQNDFRKALEDVEEEERNKLAKGGQSDANKGKEKNRDAETQVDLTLIKTDPDKLYPVIYYALKKTLAEWGQWMDERPESVKRTNQGKIAAATQVQSGEYLKPLFRALRSRSLASDVLARIAEIVYYMQMRQYQRANDAYLRLSIGNAPWPIGVTMVGIHERSAREKISSDQVAHVLNDEVSRKYIQSLKRLLTFSQTKYPPEDSSQLMG